MMPRHAPGHCGLDWRTRFDASYGDLGSRSGGSIGDPYQDGTMTLASPTAARFDLSVSGQSKSVLFTRHPAEQPLKGPVGCD
jgi:hypothetical protein